MFRHRGSIWETRCAVFRPCVSATAASAARAAARRLESDEIVGTADSLRWVCGLEEPGFGRNSEQDGEHLCPRSPAGRRVKARSRGKPKGATGEPDVATRPASNGLLAGTPLGWGRLSESGLASVSLQDGRRANHERGRVSGERPSNGAVTVSTSSGGERFEGSAPVRSVGVRRQRRSSA
jgi:hypothetical protein